MNRNIPGTIEVAGREFLYVESMPDEGFSRLVSEALNSSPDIPSPTSGGIMEEKVRIILHGNTSLLSISYKGDLPGWKAKLLAYCRSRDRKWGVISGDNIELSDGTEVTLWNCRVVFDS